MAKIDQCVPGLQARIINTGVARVRGRTGTIVEVSRVKRSPDQPVKDLVTVDIPGHGDIVVAPDDLEVVTS
jgi:hypothetical protein